MDEQPEPGRAAALRPERRMPGAPVSVTAVGLWELSRLRSRHGPVVRDLLMREGAPRAGAAA
ncbi:hypothetical protein [Streptomyces sp. bgisy027]|uniref:hypothetical protein n=1 Tax=unclassified Streptomyces TaxID=2593676 RepID=UPI003D74C16D